MRTVNNIKIRAASLCMVLLCGLGMQAIAQPVSRAVKGQLLTAQQQHYLDALLEDESTYAHEIVEVNPKAIAGITVEFEVFGQKYSSRQLQLNERAFMDYSWLGRVDEDPASGVIFVVNGDKVTGIFTLQKTRFMLYPLGDGLHVMIMIDGTRFPQDESEEDYREMNEPKDLDDHGYIGYDPGEVPVPKSASNDCSIRYLLAYTPAVESNLADVHGFMQGCIDDHNLINMNSNGQHTVELARSVRVSYSESGTHSLDRDRFLATNDGFMDEIHDLRALYDADVCQLFVNSGSGCGIAAGIGSTFSTAFAVTKRSCAIGNHTFAHETGHLYGCRHDPFADPTIFPFPHAHGYVYIPGLWRTVMAYNDACDCSDEIFPCPDISLRATPGSPSCERLAYWSNPSVSYLGNPMGTPTLNDNAFVVRNEHTALAAFEAKVNNKQVYENETILSDQQGHFEGNTSVTAPGSGATALTYNSGSAGTIRANQEITLVDGFWARAGTTFSAYIGNCPQGAILDMDALADEHMSDEEEMLAAGQALYDSKTKVGRADIAQAIPNPFRESSMLILEIGDDMKVSAGLYDMLGKPVLYVLQPTFLQAGSHQYDIQGQMLPSGIYILQVQLGSEVRSLKIVKQH